MSHSVSPLGSLSSPSPSPPPNPIDESELSELTDDDPDNHDTPPRNSSTTRQRQPLGHSRKSLPAATYSARSSSSKRKKRGGLVPAPMWDWAYKNGATGSPSETPTPANGISPPPSHPPPGPSRLILPDTDPVSHPSKPSPTPDAEEEEEEELPTPPRAMEEEEGEDTDPRRDRPPDRRHKRQPLVRPPRKKERDDPSPSDLAKLPRSKRVPKIIPGRIHDKFINKLWERGFKVYDPEAPSEDDSDNNKHLSEDDPSPSPDDDMDVDKVHDPTSVRQSPARPPFKPSPPPSTSAVDPPNDIPSIPPSMRASVDPTIAPQDEDVLPVTMQDEDVDQDNYPDPLDDDDAHPVPDGDMELDADEDEDVPPEEPSQPPSPTPLAEPGPEPEPELEDEDPDLQPAHRAEALDVLATIELKFALLRERVYVEKLEGLAWEEALVCDGTHPELHYLQNELTKRRDKRLTLASKKRTYEIEALTRKRREEEAWCQEGWDIARVELQTEMIAETNRKRRKLERERRTIERPPGARHIPSAILNPPPAPTLRQIANTFPLPSHLSHFALSKKPSNAKGVNLYPGLDGLSGVTAYPDLPTLSPHDIAADLDFLFQHRRMGFGFGIGYGPSVGVPVAFNGTGFSPAPIGFGGPASAPGFGPVESYPPHPGPGITPNNPTHIGAPPLPPGGPLPPPPPPSGPSQNTTGPMSIQGPGIPNIDGPSFSQPAMGVFQGPPSTGGYPLGPGVGGESIVIGPGGATSTPVVGPGGPRIPRPFNFTEREREPQRDKERELIQRDREFNPRDRDLAARERDMRDHDREREPNIGPGYPAWGPKPAGGMDWGVGDARRREEKERLDRHERDRERDRPPPPIPSMTHRHLHHPHPHIHQMQQHPGQPHQPHPVHANQSHHHQHHHAHGQHSHHTQNSHVPPHHHVAQHHHHRHHHHVVHHHHSGVSSSGPDGASPNPPGSGPAPSVQTMEIINLSVNPSSKSHWKRDETKLGGGSMPGSRPSSTHPLPPPHNYDERDRDRERERERERDRPVATPFVLAPSHHTISSAASSPRHGWTPGPGEPGPASSNSSAPFSHPPERYHTPPHRYSNPASNGLPQLPRPLTTSPPRAPPTSSPSMNGLPSTSSSTGPFPLPRKPSPALPKQGIPIGYSPRLAGPGVVPPTGPGVPGVLSNGPGVTPSGILTSGPGVPPGPGIAPAPESSAPSIFTTARTTSPLITYSSGPPVLPVSSQKVSVDGS